MNNKTYRELRNEIEESAETLDKNVNAAIRNLQIARSAAYKMAVAFQEIQGRHLAELQQEIKARFPHAKDGIESWLMEEFKQYVAIGGDVIELLRAVRNKVSRKDFLAGDFVLPLSRSKKGRLRPSPDIHVPERPAVDVPVDELLRRLNARCEALEAKVKALLPLQGENELLKRKLRQFQALASKVDA